MRQHPLGMILVPLLLGAIVSTSNAQAPPDEVQWQSGNARVDSLVNALTPEEKILLVHGFVASEDPGDQQQAAYVAPVARLGIPAMRLTDGEAGINVVNNATAIPVQLNVAATWSKKAAYDAGVVTGQESYLLGNGVALAPRVNILRDPLTGNFWQSYSEDPFLNAVLGIEGTAGVQDQNVMANAKQIGPSSTGASSGDLNSIVDFQTLHELYWSAPGALLSEGNAATLMCSYARINGEPACSYPPLFRAVRDLYNSTAIVMSDWLATHSTAASIVAGMDWEMPNDTYYGRPLYESIYVAHNLSETYLDRALGHILGKYDEFGYLDGKGPLTLNVTPPLPDDTKERSAQTAYDIALKSGILLKNDGNALPLSKESSVAIIGPNGLQYSHGTNFAERAYGFPDRQISPLDAWRHRTGIDIPNAVGIDQEGSLVPSSALKTQNGTSGLARSDGSGARAIDTTIDFTGDNALPANQDYQWSGYLVAPEDGLYTISLQRQMPSSDGRKNSGYGNTFDIATLSINVTEVANGYRLFGDGGAKPWSNSIATRAGWDNVKATVYLAKGEHELAFGFKAMLQQSIHARLAWVTPSARNKTIEEAVAIAKTVHTPIVFAFANSPAQIGLHLDDSQDELIDRIAEVNANSVVVLNNAEPVLMPWLGRVAAVLEMGYAGQEGGWATADLLLGNHYPQGRLPVTYPTSVNSTITRNPAYPGRVAVADGNATFSEGLNVGYRWYKSTETPVLFPFGYGLSYTSFQYSDLQIAKSLSGKGKYAYKSRSFATKRPYHAPPPSEASYDAHGPDAVFSVSFTVQNDGSCAGVEVPQVYLGPPRQSASNYPDSQFASIVLAGFDNICLRAGESKRVEIGIRSQQLKYWDVGKGEFLFAKGERDVFVGRNAQDATLVGRITV